MRALRLGDGRRLFWREAGSGPPLVLLHGWAMSSAVFAEAVEDLGRDFRVLAPDLRGHGRSEGGEGYAFSDLAADVAEWMSALGVKGPDVAGWSMGGQVALALSLGSSASLCKRLILVSATPRFTTGADWPHGLPRGQVRAMSRDLRRGYEKTMGDFFRRQFEGEELSRERFREMVGFAVRQGSLPHPDVALAGLETLAGEDLRHRLPEVTVPALVLHGESDRIVPVGAGLALARQLPEAQLRLFPAIGHAPFLSRPKEVFDAWRAFLK